MRTLIPINRPELVKEKLDEFQAHNRVNLLTYEQINDAVMKAVSRLIGVPMVSWEDIQIVVDPYSSPDGREFSTVAVLEYIPTVNMWGILELYRDQIRFAAVASDDAPAQIRVRPDTLGTVLKSYVQLLENHGIRVSGLSDRVLSGLLEQVEDLMNTGSLRAKDLGAAS